MTFFLADTHWRDLRRVSGCGQIANVEKEPDEPLPESPSAVARLAVEFLLDHIRRPSERSDEDWERLLGDLREALKE